MGILDIPIPTEKVDITFSEKEDPSFFGKSEEYNEESSSPQEEGQTKKILPTK